MIMRIIKMNLYKAIIEGKPYAYAVEDEPDALKQIDDCIKAVMPDVKCEIIRGVPHYDIRK